MHRETNEKDGKQTKTNAWLVHVDDERVERFSHGVVVTGSSTNSRGIFEGNLVFLHEEREGRRLVVAVGRVYRIRTSLDSATFLFGAETDLEIPVVLNELDLEPDDSTWTTRIEWAKAISLLQGAGVSDLESIPLIEDHAYVRDLLQMAVVDDLLGPADGPFEEVVGMSVRDRYLVGKLAPRTADEDECIEGLQGPAALDEGVADGETPDDLRPFEEVGSGRDKGGRRRLPGEEFASTKGVSDPDDDESQAVDASKNQSVVPSSLGLTVCVDGAAETLDLEVRWGRYVRTTSEKQTTEAGKPLRAWKRIPSGGKVSLSLKDGQIEPVAPDPECPKVVIQGTVRPPLASGERLVTIFLVNDQPKPDRNQDEAWLFQPELIIRHPKTEAVFRRRPVLEDDDQDPERAALEMILRRRVEFAVGHGVSVHAEAAENEPERAHTVRTRVLPQYEVAITETPGLDPEDRPALCRMVDEGLLDMRELADMERSGLIAALSILTDDYEAWIGEQRARIGKDVDGYDAVAGQTMDRCDDILQRLREGISMLDKNDKALDAFRFANRAMAIQHGRSIYALRRRRGEKVELAEIDIRENRSWRPFQLAFILLSIPALTDPGHPDRTKRVDAIADLLWFPAGGGKTEAYLGVAAFTMAMRRLQGDMGGLDASRGLSVIMRYTLRLLTVQQFHRATALICAMEALRRTDDETWGTTPFTIGLWVGQRVTPNDTESSHEAIEAERTGKRPTLSSPAQLTFCPWCGSEISAGRDIKVRRFGHDIGRTLIYCSVPRNRGQF